MALIFLVVAVAIAALAPASVVAQVPDWVPERYRSYVHRHVDDRTVWERALASLPALGIPVEETGRSFALVAGVSRYPRMIGKAGDLWPARVDVEKVVAYLAREPEAFNEIVVLLDDDVTPDNLRYFLTRYFPRRLSEAPRSRFLFAYSGHGMTARTGRGYLLTSRARNLHDHFEAGIPLVGLRADFQEIVDTGHHVLALINACYGASFHRLSLAFGPNDPVLPTKKGAHAITAGGAGELTWSDQSFGIGDGPKGSLFFEAVLAALSDGRADRLPRDGIVTVGELGTYVRQIVKGFTDERQNPQPGDLIAERSPGGFFFLDRDRQMAMGNATPLGGEWWRGISFGSLLPPVLPTPEARGVKEGLIAAMKAQIREYEAQLAGVSPEEVTGERARSYDEATLWNAEGWLTVAQRRSIQESLRDLGHYGSSIDGVFGAVTRSAITAYQVALGSAGTGYLTPEQGDELLTPAVGLYPRPPESFRDCDVCPEMVRVPAGRFTMGSPAGEEGRDIDEGPQHEVRIGPGLSAGRFEVTFAEWDACVAAGGCGGYRPDDMGWDRAGRPVVKVNWADAQSYVSWLSGKTGRGYRLLSESEWEYVARAGSRTPFHTGETITTDQANFDGNYTYGGSSKGIYRKQTVPAGSFRPNAWGLHDVHGNVWEWVEDCYERSYAGAPLDGSARTTDDCERRVARGGSWSDNPRGVRAANRGRIGPDNRVSNLGFRVARTD